jgi:hypothetical protein
MADGDGSTEAGRDKNDLFAAYVISVTVALAAFAGVGVLSRQSGTGRVGAGKAWVVMFALCLLSAILSSINARWVVRSARMRLARNVDKTGWPVSDRRRRLYHWVRSAFTVSGALAILASCGAYNLEGDRNPAAMVGFSLFLDGVVLLFASWGVERAWLLPPVDPNQLGRDNDKLVELVRILQAIREFREQAQRDQEQAAHYRREIAELRMLADAEEVTSVLLGRLRREEERRRRSDIVWDLGLLVAGAVLGVLGNAFTPEIVAVLRRLFA